ncbi:hypothetical protein [Methanoculleus chikugoensis]|uniref:hypothetical protein n=1 Tax=Methanoculleus chikugoensis TaxID=118126 RepID=UPI000AD60887|nr:hypothetical protein [Methanoculleus chikugoensis]
MAYRHLFGPVPPSRRLGVSLGVDLVPQKTCAYNCVYCECGRTTSLTCERREYVPTGRVIAELDDFLAKGAGSRLRHVRRLRGNRRFTPGSGRSSPASKTGIPPATGSRS